MFQEALRDRFAYVSNGTALRPDEFYSSGGGDCEDWALMTAGLLRFWGFDAFVGSLRPPDDSSGHAVCLVRLDGEPKGMIFYPFEESGAFNGTDVDAGYYVPIDYQHVGSLSSAVGKNWRLRYIYIPEEIYGSTM